MAKAEEAYHKRDLYSDGAVMTLARYHARETIKRELKAQGIKLASVESCEITRAANRYLITLAIRQFLGSKTVRRLFF
jgi:hypothetical protein